MDPKLIFDKFCDAIDDFDVNTTFIESVNDQKILLGEAQIRLMNIISLDSQIRDAFNILKRLDVSDNERKNILTRFLSYSQICFTTMGKFQELINRKSSAEASMVFAQNLANRCQVKQSQIRVPVFTGELTDWMEFKDCFEALVDQNMNLSKLDKFSYLQSFVKLPNGKKSVLNNCFFSEDNYDIAWSSLCERYNDQKQLKNEYFSKMLSVKSMTSESAIEILRVVDEFSSILTSLDSLNTTYDDVIVQIVQSALHKTTLKDWLTRNGNNDASWPKLKIFLTQQWKVLKSVNKYPDQQALKFVNKKNAALSAKVKTSVINCQLPKCEI